MLLIQWPQLVPAKFLGKQSHSCWGHLCLYAFLFLLMCVCVYVSLRLCLVGRRAVRPGWRQLYSKQQACVRLGDGLFFVLATNQTVLVLPFPSSGVADGIKAALKSFHVKLTDLPPKRHTKPSKHFLFPHLHSKSSNWCLMALCQCNGFLLFCCGFQPPAQNYTVHILDGWWELHMCLYAVCQPNSFEDTKTNCVIKKGTSNSGELLHSMQ